jgi:hypothetical protein
MTEPNMGSPLPEQPIPSNVPPSLPENKSNKKLVIILVVVILILAGGLAYVLFGPKKSPAPTSTVNSTAQNSAASPQLLYTSSSDITLIDSAGKQVYKTNVPTTGDYIFYEAQSPSGKVLLNEEGRSNQASSFLLLDSKGNKQQLPTAVNAALNSATEPNLSHMVRFLSENELAFVTCNGTETCKLVRMSLQDGSTKTIYDTQTKHIAPAPPAYLIGQTSDRQSLYLAVMASGANASSVVDKVDASSGKVLQSIKIKDAYPATESLSPDLSKLLYKTGGSDSPTVLHLVDMNTGNETTTNWDSSYIDDDTFEFQWSPDSKKVLFHSDPTGDNGTINMAYYDVSSDKITPLRAIEDSAHHLVEYQGWIDNQTIVYQEDTSTTPHDFTVSDRATYKQDIGSNQAFKLSGGYGGLLAILR